MTGHDGFARGKIKAVIAFLLSGIANENTPRGAKGKFMRASDIGVRVAKTSKGAEMVIGGMDAE
jgi:hypothetical protein